MQQVAGPFRGRAKPEQLFGIGVGILRMDQDLPEERQPPDPPNGGCPKPEQLFAFRPKKNWAYSAQFTVSVLTTS